MPESPLATMYKAKFDRLMGGAIPPPPPGNRSDSRVGADPEVRHLSAMSSKRYARQYEAG